MREPASKAGRRLATMEESGYRFTGVLRRIRLASRLERRGAPPGAEAEIEQILALAADGSARLTRHFRTEAGESRLRAEKRRFRIPRRDASAVLRAVEDFLLGGDPPPSGEGAGTWRLTLTDSAGRKFHASGRLCPGEGSAAALSELMRSRLDRFDLLALDGSPDRVDRVEVLYRRTAVHPKLLPEDPEPRPAVWNCRERLTLDREAGTLELNREIGAECRSMLRASLPEGIAGLLDKMGPNALAGREGYPEDAIADPDDRRDYAISVRTMRGRERMARGAFDRDGLPADWPDFIEGVYRCITFYGLGEMFSPRRYERPARRRSDRRFCFVSFDEGGREYSYLADDVELEEGDLVVVPVGRDMREAVAMVERVLYLPESEAPYPMDRIKHVLRKCEEED